MNRVVLSLILYLFFTGCTYVDEESIYFLENITDSPIILELHSSSGIDTIEIAPDVKVEVKKSITDKGKKEYTSSPFLRSDSIYVYKNEKIINIWRRDRDDRYCYSPYDHWGYKSEVTHIDYDSRTFERVYPLGFTVIEHSYVPFGDTERIIIEGVPQGVDLQSYYELSSGQRLPMKRVLEGESDSTIFLSDILECSSVRVYDDGDYFVRYSSESLADFHNNYGNKFNSPKVVEDTVIYTHIFDGDGEYVYDPY